MINIHYYKKQIIRKLVFKNKIEASNKVFLFYNGRYCLLKNVTIFKFK